jgi:hypothetical protein
VAVAFQANGPSSAEALDVDPLVWQLGVDYPETLPGDVELPIKTIYIKTHDATEWMSVYDDHPKAVSGPDAIRDLIDIYGQQGIEVAAWFVPKGTDYQTQFTMALQVIDAGVTALYADLEPFQGFCYLQCRELADNLWKPLRAARPNTHLGVIYDPRPWWWQQSATSEWLSVADSALPMCYWEDFTGQEPYNDPAGCVIQAHADLGELAPGRALAYIPMLQGNSTAAKFEKALDAAASVGSAKVSVWRRGVINTEVWELIGQYQEPNFFFCRQTLADGCLFREVSTETVWVMAAGARWGMPSPDSLFNLGFTWDDVQLVEDGFLAQAPIVPPDGTVVFEEDSAERWVVIAGAKFRIADADYAPLGLDPAVAYRVPATSLNQVPATPPDFTQLREVSGVDTFLVFKGMRIRVDEGVAKALEVLGFAAPAHVVPDGALQAFSVAEVGSGDTDCSGVIETTDVLNTLALSSGLPNGAICHQSADVNCDGLPAGVDALLILVFVIGGEPLAPGCEPVGTLAPLE